MQRFIYFIVFAVSSAVDVSVYNASDLFSKNLIDTVSYLSFGYLQYDMLNMRIYITNTPPGVNAISVTYQMGLQTVEFQKSPDIYKLFHDEYFYWVRHIINYPEVKVSVKLYKSHSLCSTIIVAEGRDASSLRNKMAQKTYTYTDICLRQIPCSLLVNLKHECEGPSIGTRNNKNLKTTNLTYSENNNDTSFVTYVSPSSHGNVKTSTNSSANNTVSEVQHTNNTFIILGSLSGIMLSLLAIIAVWRRCWIKRKPQGTPDLPTNHPSEPFYLNMLFRRECDQEIAEIEQHHYEEITPQVTEGSGHIQ